MTVQDYIDKNYPFYHITFASNEESIKRSGLKKGQCNAICVVRTNDSMIINDIATAQLGIEPDSEALLIKILPQENKIFASMIAEDSVDEITAKLYNYIIIDCILFDEKTYSDCFTKFFVKNVDLDENRVKSLINELSLTDYQNTPIPHMPSADSLPF